MASFTGKGNAQILEEAEAIQDKTKESILRMKQQTAESEQIGQATLEELRRQGEMIDENQAEVDQIDEKLNKASSLQNEFDRWAGNWFGGKKRAAQREAKQEIENRRAEKEEGNQLQEVYEHAKYDSIKRKWRFQGLFTTTLENTQAPDLFDPKLQATIPDTRWSVDFSSSEIDAEGWTYGYDFATLNKGKGDRQAKWNSYVRRRKWRFTESSSKNSEAVNEIKARNDARTTNKAGSSQAEKIGYVPRSQLKNLAESGFSKTNKDENLDDDAKAGLGRLKQNDTEIDQGLDEISNSLDTLTNISQAMNEEARSHTSKLDKLANSMDKVADKQSVVNSRLKRQLK